MNQCTVTGRIISFGDVETGTGQKGVWKKRNIIVETQDQYPKKICLTAWNKVCDSLSMLSVGDELSVEANVESREYNKKWYTEIKPFKVINDGVNQEWN